MNGIGQQVAEGLDERLRFGTEAGYADHGGASY
jgi:hypothetical protein